MGECLEVYRSEAVTCGKSGGIWASFVPGNVLITMGTGKMSQRTEKELGLAGEHDYAVLDLREVDGQRLMLIKNPWCEGRSWIGKLKSSERNSSSEEEAGDIIDDLGGDEEPVQNSRDLLNADDELSPGCFWMDLHNVIQNFESIYLNWNPGLFAFREDMHFAWDLTPPQMGGCKQRGRFASLHQHPQYTVTAEKGGTVWVLLWRHFQNAVPADATVYFSRACLFTNPRLIGICVRYTYFFVPSLRTLAVVHGEAAYLSLVRYPFWPCAIKYIA